MPTYALKLSSDAFVRQRDSFVRTLRAVQRTRDLALALTFDKEFPPATASVEPGLYACMRRTEAITLYLYVAGVPQTIEQIVEGLKTGGLVSRAVDDYKATYAALYHGRERNNRFRKFGVGRYWTLDRKRQRALRAVKR